MDFITNFRKLNLIMTICLFGLSLTGQKADVAYVIKINQITSYQGNLACGCREPFDKAENYTAIVKVITDEDPTPVSSGCQTCDYNGDCTYGSGLQIINRTDNSSNFIAFFHAWEDDGGDRCTYDDFYESVQCPTIFSCPCEVDMDTDEYPFRVNSWPSNGSYTNTQSWGDHQYLCTEINHEFSLKYTWKYAATSNAIELDCINSPLEYSQGHIPSWCIYLHAGIKYRFTNTSFPNTEEDTYMRIYHPNGYSFAASNNNISGSELNSRIEYTPSTSGYYFLELSHNFRGILEKSGHVSIDVFNPSNDHCTNAINLPSGVTLNYSTFCTSQFAPAQTCGGNNIHNDVWYKFQPTAAGSIQVNNCALTNYDSRISIYTGSCENLIPAASTFCNDNDCGISSRITLSVCKGQTYFISVGGTNGAFGFGKIALTFTASNTAPTINCPSNTTLLAATDVCGAQYTYTTPSGTDNCPGASTSRISGLASGSTFPVGTTTNTFKVTDADGATATCSFAVTVLDQTAPTITCPGYLQITSCEPTAVYYSLPVVSDNCQDLAYGIEQINGIPSGGTFPFGTTTNTYRAVDLAGNVSATCSFLVEVTESGPPTINCPDDFSVQANTLNNCKEYGIGYEVTATSEGCSATVEQLEGITPGYDLPFGLTHNVFKVTDSEGTTATCDVNITVVDLIKPMITCPSNIMATSDPGDCEATVTYNVATGTDNCFGPSFPVVVKTSGLASGSAFPLGVSEIVYTATDYSGNSKSCSFTVTVNDGTIPDIDCPENIELASLSGDCGAYVVFDEPDFSDNCAGSELSQTAGLSSGAFFPVGNTNVVYQVTDASGLTNTCSFSVSVTDDESPEIGCPENVILYASSNCTATLGSYLLANKHDNCTPNASITESQSNSGDGSLSGHDDVETVILTATDASGNSQTCAFTVTLKDTTRPLISCPPNVTLAADVHCKATIGTYTLSSKSDNCTATASISVVQTFSGDGILSGHNDAEIVYLTASDQAGNGNNCSFTVTLKDVTPLSLTCPPDIIYETGSGSCGPVPKALVALGSPVANDNCFVPVLSNTAPSQYNLGNTTVKWTATDGLGNSSTCNQKVTVKVGECGVPVQVLHKDTTDHSAKIQWNAGVPCVTGYQLRLRYEESPGVWSAWTSWTNASGPGKEHAFSGLSATTFYQYQIRSKCGPNANSTHINGWFYTKSSGGSIRNLRDTFDSMLGATSADADALQNRAEQSYISIVPNPANGRVDMDLIGFEENLKELQLIDFSGKIVFQKTLFPAENKCTIDLLELNIKPGLYLLKVQHILGHTIEKLMVVE